MHRWSPLNDRQRALLGRLDSGEDLGAQDPGERPSAYALRDRGLLTIQRRKGIATAQVTAAGKFYLEHGHHPDHPAHSTTKTSATTSNRPSGNHSTPQAGNPSAERQRSEGVKKSPTPYGERPIPRVRQAKAAELTEQLVAERQVTISEPDEEEITEWRRVVDYAKRYGLVPAGKRIETQRLWNRGRDLQISLLDGPHPNSRQQKPDTAPHVPVPKQLRAPHPVVAALREDRGRLLMPPLLRHRALLILQGLAAEAVRRGHKVRDHPVPDRYRTTAYSHGGRHYPSSYSRREGEAELAIGEFAYTVTIKQESPQATDPERATRLLIELGYSRAHRQSRWADRKRWQLEDILGAVLRELEMRAVEDAQRKADEERAKAERKVRWQTAMEEAKEQAIQAQYADILRTQAKAWRETALLRAYCEALEHRLDTAEEAGEPEVASARQWLDWIRSHIEATDPLRDLPTISAARQPKAEELKPYLKGWSPYGPEEHLSRWGSY